MDIKIEDYLDEQEIKEICKDALYQKIRESRGKAMSLKEGADNDT